MRKIKKLKESCKEYAEKMYSELMKKRAEYSESFWSPSNEIKDIHDSIFCEYTSLNLPLQYNTKEVYLDTDKGHMYMVRTKKNFIVFITKTLYYDSTLRKLTDDEIVSELEAHNDDCVMIPASLPAAEIKAMVIRYISDVKYEECLTLNITEDDDDEEPKEFNDEDEDEELDDSDDFLSLF